MKEELFNELQKSVQEMQEIRKGKASPGRIRIVEGENVIVTARVRLGLTQEKFAALLSTPVGTLRNWEQGRREPPSTVKLLARIAEKNPQVVLESSKI